MNAAVQQRLSQVTTWRNLTAGITALALAFALALSWLITRSLADAAGARAIAVFGNISAGKYDNEIDAAGTDEAGQVLRALDEMQGKLRTQIETERAVAAENTRIRQALDKVSTSVVLADAPAPDHLSERHRAGDLRAQPARDPQDACRTSMRAAAAWRRAWTSLSTDPGQQRRVLDTLAGSDTQERVLGACTFRTVTNPVLNDKRRAHRHGRWNGPTARRKSASRRRCRTCSPPSSAATSASASSSPARRASSRR